MSPKLRLLIVSMVLAALALAMVGGALLLARLAPIGTAFVAKTLCTGVFASRLPEARVRAEELAAGELPLVAHVEATVDEAARSVSATAYGTARRVAVHREGEGCTLAIGVAPEALRGAGGRSETVAAAGVPAAAPEGIDRDALERVLDAAFAEPGGEQKRRTRAIVVMKDGRVIAERYAAGIGADTPLPGWSMAKSAMNALAGILVRDGRAALDRPLPVPEWDKSDPRSEITLDQMLRMTTGLRFDEDYRNPLSDVVVMLFAQPSAGGYAASKQLDARPGTRWVYASGTSNLLARSLQLALPKGETLGAFARRELFAPLGMTSAVLETDASGVPVGSSFMLATARDWARLGQLYLRDGVWEGRRILPEGWVRHAFEPVPAPGGEVYGAHFWRALPGKGRTAPLPPAIHAIGHEAQFLSIVPSHGLVVVRLGLSRPSAAWDQAEFLGKVVEAVSAGRAR